MTRTCVFSLLSILLAAAPVSAADGDAILDSVNPPVATIPRPPSRPPVLPVLYGTLAGLHAYDGWSTMTGVRRGAREANPAIAAVASHPSALWAVKAGATMASIHAAETLWKRHRRAEAIAAMVAVNGLMAAIAVHNGAVLHELK